MILLPAISVLICGTAPSIPGLRENRIAFYAVSMFALFLIVLFMILLENTKRVLAYSMQAIGKHILMAKQDGFALVIQTVIAKVKV